MDLPTGVVTQIQGDFQLGGFGGNGAINGNGTRVGFFGVDAESSEEIYVATCPLDSDADGLPDDIDPDAVVGLVEMLPDLSFAATVHRTAILAQLEAVEEMLLAGEIDDARDLLLNFRKHVDGCGAAADNNDWIVDCIDQLVVRGAIDAILTAL